ncbi:hypothetical protein ACJMK2_000061 [Sinanodonta woodiana]|uniref:Peptidase M12B domain-containing protein n=1 Tax=Sinanodonta woodiana TaxID=1069815 RepID=A0ABD3XPW9_SINWO
MHSLDSFSTSFHILGLEASRSVEDISHMRATILLGKTRHKRALVQHRIELLMVVDYAAYEWWSSLVHETVTQSTEADVMRMIHQYYAYTYSGLDLKMQSILDEAIQIKLAFVGLIVAKTPEDSYWTTGPSVSSSGGSTRRMLNASMALDNFQIWLDQNAVDLPPYDHAMLFTGYNLTYGGSAGNTGLAFKGSICRNVSNSSVVEDVYDSRTAIYAAQQLSRSLGARDDMDGNKCFSFSNYIMTPKVRLPLDRSVSSLSSFSPCSLSYFRQYIEKLNSEGINCMLSTGARPWGNHLTNQLSEIFTDLSPFPGVLVDSAQFQDWTIQLPGMAYTGDQQCMNSFGAGSYVCRGEITGDYHNICQGLLCHVPLTGFCDYILPADGTPCGNMSICMKGKCVILQSANDTLLDNCPFGDQPLSDCHLLVRSRPYSCYNNTVKFSCCGSCTEIQESFLPGCEYGNRIDTCSMKDCTTGDKNYRDFLCCWTCVNGPTPYSPPSIQYETGISPTMFDISDNSVVVSCYEQLEQGNTTSPNVSPNIATLPDVSIDEMSKISPEILTGSSPGILAGSSPGILTGSSPGILTGSSPGTLSRTFMALTGFSLHTSSQKSLNLVTDIDMSELPIMKNEMTSRGSAGDVDAIFPSSNTVTAAMTTSGFYNESFSRSNIFVSSAASIVVSTTESSVKTVADPIVQDLPMIVTKQIRGRLRQDGTTTGTSAFVSSENHMLHPTISLSNGATFFRSGDSLATTTITMPTTLNSINEPDSSNRVHSSDSSVTVSSSMVNSQGQESDLIGETSTLRLLPSEETGSLMSFLQTGTYIQSDEVVTSVGKLETLPIKSITTESHIENTSHRGSTLTRTPEHGWSTVHLKMNPDLYPNPLSTNSNLAPTTKQVLDRGNKVHTGNYPMLAPSSKQLGNRTRVTNGPKVSSNQRGNKEPGNDRSQGLQDKMSKCVVSDEQNSASIENQSIECEPDDGEPVIDRESVYNKLFPRKSQRHQRNYSKQKQRISLQ